MAEAVFDVQSAAHQMVLHIRVVGKRRLAVRMWLGGLLLRMAALVIGCDIEVSTHDAPPLRGNVREEGFDFDVGRRLRIKLNGVEQTKVIAYDTEAGTVRRYVTDENGDIVLNDQRDDLLEEELTGDVTVEWRN